MNNLVSKNPVLRFKLGRKIVKAQNSWGKGFGKIHLGANVPTIDFQMPSIEISKEQIESLPSVPVVHSSYPYRGPTVRLGIQKNPDISPSISYLNPYLTLGSTKGEIQREADEAIILGLLNYSSEENLKPASKKSRIVKKVSTPQSVFAGHRIGRTGGLNYNINDADKQQLIGTGQFAESDFKNALATQLALNRYFTNSGLGSVTEDGAWGDLSRAALALALSKSKSLTPFNNETTVVKTPIVPTYTPSTTPINLEVSNLKLNVNVPQQTYDRTGVREFIKNKGINPYSFSGALRRALRMVMNGQGTDNDKLLVKEMNIFKQGGQLPSRNIVERFKNGGVLKFLNAGSLPTAPKAERRYRKSSSNTTKKGNRETTTITSQTFGYNRNWPYFRLPATILRIVEGRDTAFIETPEHHIFTKVLPRTALKSGNTYFEYDPKYDENFHLHGQANTLANYPVTPLEYEILKRRFNTAWNLAK